VGQDGTGGQHPARVRGWREAPSNHPGLWVGGILTGLTDQVGAQQREQRYPSRAIKIIERFCAAEMHGDGEQVEVRAIAGEPAAMDAALNVAALERADEALVPRLTNSACCAVQHVGNGPISHGSLIPSDCCASTIAPTTSGASSVRRSSAAAAVEMWATRQRRPSLWPKAEAAYPQPHLAPQQHRVGEFSSSRFGESRFSVDDISTASEGRRPPRLRSARGSAASSSARNASKSTTALSRSSGSPEADSQPSRFSASRNPGRPDIPRLRRPSCQRISRSPTASGDILRCPGGHVPVTPENGLERAPWLPWRRLALRPAALNQRLQRPRWRVRQHGQTSSAEHGRWDLRVR